MKIQCQSCTKIYLIPSGQINESGRKVKCTNCNYIWYQYSSSKSFTQEKKGNNRSFLQNLALTTLACVAVTGLFFVIINPHEMKRVYNTYKDSISYKLLGYKKEQTDNLHVRKLAANEFCQDYLFLSHLKHN